MYDEVVLKAHMTANEKTWEVFRFGIYNNDGSNTHYKSRRLFVAGMADDQTHTIGHFDYPYRSIQIQREERFAKTPQ